MSKSKTTTVVLNTRYQGHLPGAELKLTEAEATRLILGKIAKAKTTRKPKATEEELEA